MHFEYFSLIKIFTWTACFTSHEKYLDLFSVSSPLAPSPIKCWFVKEVCMEAELDIWFPLQGYEWALLRARQREGLRGMFMLFTCKEFLPKQRRPPATAATPVKKWRPHQVPMQLLPGCDRPCLSGANPVTSTCHNLRLLLLPCDLRPD